MPPTTFKGLVGEVIGLVNLIIPLIFGVVFVVLIWKIFDAWVINGGDESKRDEGKKMALTSVIVLVLLLVVWGIISMLQSSIFG